VAVLCGSSSVVSVIVIDDVEDGVGTFVIASLKFVCCDGDGVVDDDDAIVVIDDVGDGVDTFVIASLNVVCCGGEVVDDDDDDAIVVDVVAAVCK